MVGASFGGGLFGIVGIGLGREGHAVLADVDPDLVAGAFERDRHRPVEIDLLVDRQRRRSDVAGGRGADRLGDEIAPDPRRQAAAGDLPPSG